MKKYLTATTQDSIKSNTQKRYTQKSNYTLRTVRTDRRQIWGIEKDIIRHDRTDRTDKTLSEVTREIEEMFEFIKGCIDPSEISYENFLARTSVLSVLKTDNAGDASRNSRGQIEEKSVLDPSSEQKPSVLNSSKHNASFPCGDEWRGTGKIDRPTPTRKTTKGQRSPEMETFKRIMTGIKEPFTFERLCNICDSAGLPPSRYKA